MYMYIYTYMHTWKERERKGRKVQTWLFSSLLFYSILFYETREDKIRCGRDGNSD